LPTLKRCVFIQAKVGISNPEVNVAFFGMLDKIH